MVEVASLEVDGEAVAVQACLLHGGSVSLYYSGYDPAWARYGVMTVLTKRLVQRAIDRGFTELDLLNGPSYDKLRWGGREVPLALGVLTNPRRASRARLLLERARGTLRLRTRIDGAFDHLGPIVVGP